MTAGVGGNEGHKPTHTNRSGINLVVSLLAGLWVFYGRAVDEGSADSVALVVDLNEISVLAGLPGRIASMLASIKETG